MKQYFFARYYVYSWTYPPTYRRQFKISEKLAVSYIRKQMIKVDCWKMFGTSISDWKQTKEGTREKSADQFLKATKISLSKRRPKWYPGPKWIRLYNYLSRIDETTFTYITRPISSTPITQNKTKTKTSYNSKIQGKTVTLQHIFSV